MLELLNQDRITDKFEIKIYTNNLIEVLKKVTAVGRPGIKVRKICYKNGEKNPKERTFTGCLPHYVLSKYIFISFEEMVCR